jgi:glycosyltransferase involved in cell wall biosynthesis
MHQNKPIVHAFFICYNEENILPHLIKYYSTFCERITILDNHSTDRSVEIIESFPNTEVIPYDSDNELNDGVYIKLKNHVWKSSTGQADYVIVGDCDEFLYHENMVDFLIEAKKNGVTIFKPVGYHMIADEDLVLTENDSLLDKVKHGVRANVLDKLMMFDCNKISNINYSFGCHNANPIGDLKLSNDNGLKMLHYKFLGLKDHMLKQKIRGERLSQFNKERGLGIYYLMSEEEQIVDYRSYLNKREEILN